MERVSDFETSQKYVTSKRTGQLGMSLISIIKTTAGIIEFKKKSLNELMDKSKSELKNIDNQNENQDTKEKTKKLEAFFSFLKKYKGPFLLYLLSLTTVLSNTGTIILTVIILHRVWC